MIQQIDYAIRESLRDYVEELFSKGWKGREREAVSLYALGHLQRYCRPDTAFHSPTQIGLEVCVPGVPRNPKGRVNKDLVIWPDAGMTTWDSEWAIVNYPLAIMEWKVFQPKNRRAQIWKDDVVWLVEFSCRPSLVGYAVSLDLLAKEFRLSVSRVEAGEVTHGWLSL
jgi:hypothetical protein